MKLHQPKLHLQFDDVVFTLDVRVGYITVTQKDETWGGVINYTSPKGQLAHLRSPLRNHCEPLEVEVKETIEGVCVTVLGKHILIGARLVDVIPPSKMEQVMRDKFPKPKDEVKLPSRMMVSGEPFPTKEEMEERTSK